ncbi:MAG: VanZ family protein [Clostridia bacterium]|nr:VanZ family protein [Clostridia bacterium]MBQ7289164.1 VanZ family protein [Clostridia bacterium]
MNFLLLKKFFCWILVIACMVLIFSFSSQTSGQSTDTSNSFIKTVISFFYPAFKEWTSAEQAELYNICSHLVRKLAHFSVFGLLGFLVTLALSNYRLSYRRTIFYSFCFCVIYAISDEIHQMFVPGRAPGFLDVLIDAVGALLGSCIIICILYIIRASKKRRQ